MNGTFRRFGSILGCALFLWAFVLPRPAVASSNVLQSDSSLRQAAYNWFSVLVGLFVSDAAELVAGPDPWGEPKPNGDLGAGIDPDG